jgi:hypothetical protein
MCEYSAEQTVRLDLARAGEPRGRGSAGEKPERVAAMVGMGLQTQFEIEGASAGLQRSNCAGLEACMRPATAREATAREATAREHTSGGSRRRMGDGE